jgi:hypothetical protein
MKQPAAWWLLLLVIVFASCNTKEDLEIKNDGSGTLVMKTDLSKMLEMIKNFAPEDSLKKDGFDKSIDTTMLMKDYVDTAKEIPADKKALLRDGKVHVVVNLKDNKGDIEMQFPFKSTDQLQKLYESLNSSTGGLKNLLGSAGDNPQMQQGTGDKGMPQITSVYDIIVKDGLYSRKVNKARYTEFADASKLEDLKKMGGMMGEMNYTLSIKLPKPIKKISNPKAVLSDDKKIARLSVDLMEVFEHPELLELEIEY